MEAEQPKNCCIFPLKMYKHKLKSYQHAQAKTLRDSPFDTFPSKNDVQTVTPKRNLTKEDKKKRIFGRGFVKVENKRPDFVRTSFAR